MAQKYIVSIEPFKGKENPRSIKIGKTWYLATIEDDSNVGTTSEVFDAVIETAKALLTTGLFPEGEPFTITIELRPQQVLQ